MADAHKLDCEAAQAGCRFIVQSENKEEAITLAKNHMRDIHERDLTDQELEGEYLQVV